MLWTAVFFRYMQQFILWHIHSYLALFMNSALRIMLYSLFSPLGVDIMWRFYTFIFIWIVNTDCRFNYSIFNLNLYCALVLRQKSFLIADIRSSPRCLIYNVVEFLKTNDLSIFYHCAYWCYTTWNPLFEPQAPFFHHY